MWMDHERRAKSLLKYEEIANRKKQSRFQRPRPTDERVIGL